ncbi:unnamed protein product [Rotaria magnacalcarata]
MSDSVVYFEPSKGTTWNRRSHPTATDNKGHYFFSIFSNFFFSSSFHLCVNHFIYHLYYNFYLILISSAILKKLATAAHPELKRRTFMIFNLI